MFFMNTMHRRRKMRHIEEVFKGVYDIKRDYVINRQKIPLLFVKQRVAVEFGEYNEGSKRTKELEKAGLKVFNTPDTEDEFTAMGRLMTVLERLKASPA